MPDRATEPLSHTGQLPRFAYATPPELALPRTATRRYPLVIVGGGLAGLTLAADLASRGVRCVLLDDDDTVGVRGAASRGIAYVQRSLEIMARIGLYARIAAKGVRWSVGQVMSGDAVLHRFDLQSGSLSVQPPFVNLQQYYVEWALVDRIAELGLTDLRWRNRVSDAELHDDHVALAVETPDGPYRLQADWVVDAEGVNSLLRRRLGLGEHTELGQDRWCITDVRFARPQANERWTWVDAPFNAGRGVWRHPMADGVWRLDFQMAPDSDPAHVGRPDVAAERVRAMLGTDTHTDIPTDNATDTDFEIVWVGPWSYRTMLIDRMRHGRLLFIGDAAHAMNPFGGRGGNSGIMDADNLGWKLALLLDERADEAILDTFETERHRAAEENIRITSRTSRFLQPRSGVESLFRSAVLQLARRFGFARTLVNTGRLCTPHHYGGLASVGSGMHDGKAVANVPLVHQGRPGTLIDLLRTAGAAPLALLFDAAEGAAGRLAAAARAAGLPLEVATVGTEAGPNEVVDAQRLLAAETGASAVGQAGQVALLRPDSHLAALLPDAEPGPLLQALRRMLGREPAR